MRGMITNAENSTHVRITQTKTNTNNPPTDACTHSKRQADTNADTSRQMQCNKDRGNQACRHTDASSDWRTSKQNDVFERQAEICGKKDSGIY